MFSLLKTTRITPKQATNNYIESLNSTPLKDGMSLYEFLKRPEITIKDLEHFIDIPYDNEVKEQVEINTKYEGYIKKANKEAEKMLALEEKKIPENIDYNKIPNLASEARQKLSEIMPATLGQASRISGVNPADISIMMVYLRRYNHD